MKEGFFPCNKLLGFKENVLSEVESLNKYLPLLEDMAIFYSSISVVIAIISFLLLKWYSHKGEISLESLKGLAIWFFIASPTCFFVASGTLQSLTEFEKNYYELLLSKSLNGNVISNLWLYSQNIANSLDTKLLLKLQLFQVINGFFKYFVPASLLAFGAWASVKYLDYKIRIKET